MTQVTLHNRKIENVLVDDDDAARMAPHGWLLEYTPGGSRIYCKSLRKNLATFILGRKPNANARLEFLNGDRRDYTRANIRWNAAPPICSRCGGTKFAGPVCLDCTRRHAIDRI